MNSVKWTRNTLFAAYLVYFAQGAFYPSGSILSELMLLVILIIDLFFFFKVNLYKYVHPLVRYLSVFYILNALYFLLSEKFITSSGQELTGIISTFSQFKTTSIALLSFFPFYYFNKKNEFSSKSVLIFAGLFFIVSIFGYYFNLRNLLLQLGRNSALVNNMAYYFVVLIPVVYLIKNKVLSMLFWIAILFFVIESAKRGAIVSVIITLFIYLIYIITERKGHLIRNLSFAIIVLAIVVYFGYEQIVSNDSLLARIERSQTHGMGQRSFMYPALFKYWYQSENPLNLLFGYGYSTPVKIVGNYAHNDWLELLTSFGLTGVFIYVMIFVQFVRLSIKKLMPANLRFLVLTVVLSLLSRSIFSMGYISDITFISMLFIVLAIEANPRNQKDDENIVRN